MHIIVNILFMNLQYISDNNGIITGVYIPIMEWNELHTKFKEIKNEQIYIPAWQMDVVKERIQDYKSKPSQAVDFDEAMDDILKDF